MLASEIHFQSYKCSLQLSQVLLRLNDLVYAPPSIEGTSSIIVQRPVSASDPRGKNQLPLLIKICQHCVEFSVIYVNIYKISALSLQKDVMA